MHLATLRAHWRTTLFGLALSGCVNGKYVGPPITFSANYTQPDGSSIGGSFHLDPSSLGQKANKQADPKLMRPPVTAIDFSHERIVDPAPGRGPLIVTRTLEQ